MSSAATESIVAGDKFRFCVVAADAGSAPARSSHDYCQNHIIIHAEGETETG